MGIKVLDPTSGPAKKDFNAAPRVADLNGKVLGFLNNGKPGTDETFQALLDLIRADYNLEDVVFRQKDRPWNLAPEEVYKDLAALCDIAITGMGD